MLALGWGEGSEAAVEGAVAAHRRMQLWRGVREPERWVCLAEGDDAAINEIALRLFEPLGTWSIADGLQAPLANFVIRVVTAEAYKEIASKLVEQANSSDGVLGRPGCVGLTLAAEVERPESMLGISYWSSLGNFDNYARWAQTAPWKDVITPVTVDVPLRLLTRRTSEEKEPR